MTDTIDTQTTQQPLSLVSEPAQPMEETSVSKPQAPSTVGLPLPQRKAIIIRSVCKKIQTSMYGERGLQKHLLKQKDPSEASSEAFLKLEEGLQALLLGCDALENLS